MTCQCFLGNPHRHLQFKQTVSGVEICLWANIPPTLISCVVLARLGELGIAPSIPVLSCTISDVCWLLLSATATFVQVMRPCVITPDPTLHILCKTTMGASCNNIGRAVMVVNIKTNDVKSVLPFVFIIMMCLVYAWRDA